MYYFYGMPLLRVEPKLLGITTCCLVTILIMLTQLPTSSSWFVFPGSQSGSRNQKRQRCQLSEQYLEFFRRDPNDFMSRLLTIEETWLYSYDPETKQQSREWRHSGSTHSKNFRV